MTLAADKMFPIEKNIYLIKFLGKELILHYLELIENKRLSDFSCLTVNQPYQLLDVMQYFLAKIEKNISTDVKISNSTHIEGNVIIGDGTKILENAVIRGPCYIGKNCIIGNNVLIWGGCHICDNSVIGFSTEIVRSYVGENVWLHQNYIGDSIVMDRASLGAHTTTANWRFDEAKIAGREKLGCIIGEDCRTGINVSLGPGVKIGARSIIGPHVNLTKDVEPNKLVLVKQEHLIKENYLPAVDSRKERLSRLESL